MSALPRGPVSGRFTRAPGRPTVPTRLSAWERSVTDSIPMLRPPRGPGGSISGSGDGWDDCDE